MKRSSYAAPYGIWMVMFTIVPLLFVVYFAFTSKTGAFTFDNFEKFMKPMYLEALFLSLKLAFFCTVICFLIGYPAAKFLASKDFSKNKSFVILILIPMWMNFLLRTYAWVGILEDTGIVNTVLEFMGLPRIQMIGTEGAVLLGMVYNFLPFMILPIYTVLKKMDTRVIEAAEDLGANPIRVFWRVTLPLSMPGVVSGITMVFMPAATTFAISRLLGNGMFWLMGDLIDYQFREISMSSGQNFGSAMSLIMMVLIIVSVGFLRRFEEKGQKKEGTKW